MSTGASSAACRSRATRAAACSGTAASSRSPRRRTVPRRSCGESGCSTICSAARRHRRRPTCHKLKDPLGFALENFDAIGAWRTTDAHSPIDPSSQLADGTKIDGPVALRQTLLRHPDAFVSTMTEKLLTYALGRGLEWYD